KTHEVIPFFHPIARENCKIEITTNSQGNVEIICSVSLHHKTGVEMEALTGASVAALTIYDMCKALSHNIEITATKLLSKTGGKSDINQT
ncbi:MAG: cyclic pyranopterin monophosphate synthase MoaC, partial [Proteobacteria bacterium]|nr:cyclic pyranopterin monophosphate synthase MoaC [Pseudomonadota bacterium]